MGDVVPFKRGWETRADREARLDFEAQKRQLEAAPRAAALRDYIWDVLTTDLEVADTPWRKAQFELALVALEGVEISEEQSARMRELLERVRVG